MASTVNAAFTEFLRDKVNLNSVKTMTSRTSRDNLLSNITGFSGDPDFFNVYTERNLKFGSFARCTKIRPLDDIDLMICFTASNDGERRTYTESNDFVYINGIEFGSKNSLLTSGTNYLNSTRYWELLFRNIQIEERK